MLEPNKNRAIEERACWRRPKTFLEKGLIAGLVVACIIALALLIALLGKRNNICTTSGCAEGTAKLLEFIDQSVNPCEDFFNFTCNTYIKNAYRDTAASPLQAINTKYENAMRGLVVEPAEVDDMHGTVVQKQFFHACMNESAIEADNNTKFLEILNEAGGWPILKGDTWNDEGDWIDIKSNLTKYGFVAGSFIQILRYDDEETNKTIPKIRPAAYIIGIKDTHKKTFVTFMLALVKALGAPDNPYTEASELVDFILKLKEINEPYPIVDDEEVITKKSLQETVAECPQIQWFKLFHALSFKNVTNSSEIVYDLGNYCKDLGQLLESTSRRTQANYIGWRVVWNYWRFLSSDIRELHEELLQETLSIPPAARHDLCYKEAVTRFKYVKETAFLRKIAPSSVREELQKMIEYIKEQFVTILSENDWMDKKTKDYAVQKAKNIESMVGAIDELYDDKMTDEILDVDGIHFTDHQNLITMMQVKRKKVDAKFYGNFYQNVTENYEAFFKNAVALNAFFLQSANLMVIPAPILQDVFYNKNYPTFMNYGAIGRVVGHEIMHGFTESARNETYENGTTFDWWTPETTAAYNKKIQCVLDQYKNWPFREELNATLTLDENVPDFVGIDAAYIAYKKWVQKNGSEKRLPGLDYTPQQVYWIQANTWLCFKKLVNVEYDLEEPDEHGIPRFRINAGIMNSKYFAGDFNCAVGTPMNPEKKCRVM